MKIKWVLVAGPALVLLLGLGVFAFRKYPARSSPVIALPETPDLSRWPAEFAARVGQARQEAVRPETAVAGLGELARLYHANNYFLPAGACLRAAAVAEPTASRWPYLLGLIEERAGRRETAEQLFARTSALAPDYAPALAHRANLLALLGRPEEARAVFERCLAVAPQEPRGAFGLAKLDYARGDRATAVARLRRLVHDSPSYQEGHLMLGDLLEKSGDPAGAAAQRAFLAAERASPPDADPYVDELTGYCYDAHRLQLLGELYVQAEAFTGALPFLERAVALEPLDPDMVISLAKVYAGLKRWTETERLLRQALVRVGYHEALAVALGNVLVAQQHGEAAVEFLRQQTAQHPQQPALLNALGQALVATGQTAPALAAFAEVTQFAPLFVDAQFNLARTQLQQGDAAGARDVARRALQLRPESADGLVVLAISSLQLQEPAPAVDAARELHRRTGALEPYRSTYVGVLFQAGNAAAEKGAHGEAEQLYREALAAGEADGQLHGALGMLYGKLRRYSEARAEFTRFTELEPGNPLGFILLGSALQAAQEPAAAREAWRTGLQAALKANDEKHLSQLRRLLNE